MDILFKGLFDAEWMAAASLTDFLLCFGMALFLGAIISLCSRYRSPQSQSYAITLAMLPSVVTVIIMLVNGNLGAGVAVAGTFSLVRFRSTPGSAKEICCLFFAMGAGLICGMGYLGFALVFTLLVCAMFLLYTGLGFGRNNNAALYKTLRIVIPEDLDYTGVFDDIFSQHLTSFELTNVKTTNMGSLYKLTYEIIQKDPSTEKEMIDQLRCRNGNLEISISRSTTANSEL